MFQKPAHDFQPLHVVRYQRSLSYCSNVTPICLTSPMLPYSPNITPMSRTTLLLDQKVTQNRQTFHEPVTTQCIKHILVKLYKLTHASSTWWSRLVHIVFGWKQICSSLASESELLQLHVCYEDSLLLCKL